MTATTIHAPAPRPPRDRPGRAGPFRWTRAAYEQAVAAGVFEPQGDDLVGPRVELLDGEIVTMPPQSAPHATVLGRAVRLIGRALDTLPAGQVHLRIQSPLALDAHSEPEPDLAVVPGDLDDYAHAHPTSALLVIEISGSSLREDRNRKALIYARSGIPEYWLINLRERAVEVRRDPADGIWRERLIVRPGARLYASAIPAIALDVGDLLR